MRANKFIAPFVALLALATLGLANRAWTTDRSESVVEPAIKLQGIDGQTYDIAALRGNVVLVSFGATWCAPCSEELHSLEELKREYSARPIKFFWVSIESDNQASDSKLKRYAKERNVTFPVLRDPAKAAFTQFSLRVRLPMVVFFGKSGQVDAPVQFGIRSQPELYKADIRARLNRLLAVRTDSDR